MLPTSRPPVISHRATRGARGAWWFARWLLVLVLAFDHLSAPFHAHHHEGVEGQFEFGAAHASFDDGELHADSDEHHAFSHPDTALRVDGSRLGQLAATDGPDVAVALVSLVALLGAPDEPPATSWPPDRTRPDIPFYRSLPPAGRAPPLHA